MDSISTLAASVRAIIFSAYESKSVEVEMSFGAPWICGFGIRGARRTVTSVPSSARMRAA